MKEQPNPETIFNEALEKAGSAECQAYLEEACGDDDELQAQVKALLDAHREAGDFMEGMPLSPEVEAELARLRPEEEGDHIGPYKLLQEIGAGGFGSVWMAQQSKPISRKVALKVIKMGMDTREVIARFEQERQALAMMDHPNIAKVFDAGATDRGRPFFVMELVKGIPITDYCDQAGLGTRERLELFGDVCSAINHAHQKGIIHRDIKPSNVMVTLHGDKPVVKVIDFGIAKATQGKLIDQTLFTRFEQFIGTPVYMSPEQAALSGLDIDTRSDIYALGVLLYELLVGKPPFDSKSLLSAGYDEMRRIIREVEPVKPSSRLGTIVGEERTLLAKAHRIEEAKLCKLVEPDLDWIVMKALEKERDRRYETANGFAADILRFLNQEPVSAGPPGIGYRMRKFVRRNRTAVAVAASILFLLITGIFGTSWFAVSAQQAKLQEEKAKEEAIGSERDATHARETAESRLRAIRSLQIKQADRQIETGEVPLGVAALAMVVRDDPGDLATAERLISCLIHRGFPVLSHAPMNHEDSVTCAEFSPDGLRVVTASLDKTARLWDARTGQALGKPMVHQGAVKSSRFSADGNRVVTASEDKTVRIWDANSGTPLGEPLRHEDMVRVAQFSPDGRQVVTVAEDTTAWIWDVDSGKRLGEAMKHDRKLPLHFSPDGKHLLLIPGGDHAMLHDAITGKPVSGKLRHVGWCTSAQFSPDGRHVLTSSPDKTIRVWDARSGKPVGGWKTDDTIIYARLSPDGKRVVTFSEELNAQVWDLNTQMPLGEPMHHKFRLTLADFSPDGLRVLTVSDDDSVRIWDAVTGKQVGEPLHHGGRISSASFSLDGLRILTASADKTALIWNVHNSQSEGPLLKHGSDVQFAEFSPDGQRVLTASADGTARIWDGRTGKPLTAPMPHGHFVVGAHFSPDGQRVATASLDKSGRIWNSVTGKLEGKPMLLDAPLFRVVFSPDGQRVAFSSPDGLTVRLFDVATQSSSGEPIVQEGGVFTTEFSPDGKRLLCASKAATAMVLDAGTGKPLAPPMRHGNWVRSASFSPDGNRVVTASHDHTARIWDSHTGNPLVEPMRHGNTVRSARFSPDGTRVVTASEDHTAQLWDARTGRPLGAPMRHRFEVWNARFSPDGLCVVTASYDGTARFWDGLTGQPLGEPMRHGGKVDFAEFSPDGWHVVSASRDDTARIWERPQIPKGPVPPWVAAWAEAVGGIRISDEGAVEVVAPTELFEIQQKIISSTDTDIYTRAAKWFFADRDLRANSPWSTE